jgi:hypothetical protein
LIPSYLFTIVPFLQESYIKIGMSNLHEAKKQQL